MPSSSEIGKKKQNKQVGTQIHYPNYFAIWFSKLVYPSYFHVLFNTYCRNQFAFRN